jgi:hypothetical protein
MHIHHFSTHLHDTSTANIITKSFVYWGIQGSVLDTVTRLRTVWYGVRIPVTARDFALLHNVQTGSRADTARPSLHRFSRSSKVLNSFICKYRTRNAPKAENKCEKYKNTIHLRTHWVKKVLHCTDLHTFLQTYNVQISSRSGRGKNVENTC